MRRSHRSAPGHGSDEVEEQELLRDAEESLVAALQESDTAVEAISDSGVDGTPRRHAWSIGLAGLALALLGLMVTRRRR